MACPENLARSSARVKAFRFSALALVLSLASLSAHALVVEKYDPAANDRFSSGYPAEPVPNTGPRFVGKGLDWSGVGWLASDPKRSFALISPRHFLYPRHWAPEVGGKIVFQNRDGELRTFTIAKLLAVELGKSKNGEIRASDAGVGVLAETVADADHIAHYRVPNLGAGVGLFIGKKVLLYGHPARIGMNEIIEGMVLRGEMSEFNYNTHGLARGMAKSELGDSGSPTFLVEKGELLVIGTHWKNDTDCFLPGLIPEITRVLAADGAALETAASH